MILDYLFEKVFDQSEIADYSTYQGSIFTAVETTDGHIGLCAAMDKEKNDTSFQTNVIRQALINAYVNTINQHFDNESFIESIPLSNASNIVMLGLIEPVFMQMNKKGIGCKIFDFRKKSPLLSELGEYEHSIETGDIFVITATTLTNRSFDDLIQHSKNNAEIYIIGPSAPMTTHLFDYSEKVRGVFGSIVVSDNVIKAILEGAGTRALSPFLKKASIIR